MQSSYLTRRVFRALLNNEPVCFSPRRTGRIYSSTPLYRPRKTYRKYGQSRTFFSFPSAPRKENADVPTSEVGLQAMSELSKAARTGGRAPPLSVLCKSFQRFFEARAEEPGVITEFHAKQLLDTYDYLRTHKSEQDTDSSAGWEAINSKESSELILYVLSQATCHVNSHLFVLRLAHHAYRAIYDGFLKDPSEMSYEAFLAWIRISAFYGNPSFAQTELANWWPRLQSWPELDAHPSPWLSILHGLALKGRTVQIARLAIELPDKHGFNINSQQHEELVMALLEQDEVEAAKVIYTFPLPMQAKPTIAATVAVARASILSDNVGWAGSVLGPHSFSPSAETRDVILLLRAGRGKNAQDLVQRLDEWCTKDPSVRDGLSVSCVNDLIRYANLVGNQQLAKEYSGLISQWNLESDLDTLILLELESRIQTLDFDGTVKILRDLEENNDMSTASINLSMRNRLIKMLCQSPNNDDAFDEVSKLLDPLVQNNTQLEAETLAALTHLLAYRHDWEALSQLLRPRLGTYSLKNERPLIGDALLRFIYDREQADDEVWEAYQLMRMAFPDTSGKTRIQIMQTFFERKMPDKGVEVFGHMRHAVSAHQRPTAEAYISCFLGLAQAADWNNIKLIRNMLKLDVDVDVDTQTRNAVLIALAACQRTDEAMDEYRAILRSEEGPSQRTLVIFFQVCESHPTGIAEAKKMLRKISALEIPLDRELYLAYVKAIAAQGERKLIAQALEETEAKIGQQPDKDMIARIYNICPHEHAKEGIEDWTKSRLPSVWQELEKAPRSDREEGIYIEGFEEVFTP